MQSNKKQATTPPPFNPVRFESLELNPLIQRALKEMGLEKPTPIQSQALPILLGEPTDFLGLAATGTGKTLAFGIPLMEKLEPTFKGTQAVVLCPTRELAKQVCDQLNLVGKYTGLQAVPIYGGSSYTEQFRGLKRGASIVVGTPGRILDHIRQGSLKLDETHTIVLDEADKMISMGFKEDLETILTHIAKDQSQVWLFCATLENELRQVANRFLKKPKTVQVNKTERIPEAIEQLYFKCHESDKPEVVCKLMDAAPDFYGIIFCQTKALVSDLTQYLKGRGYKVDCLHGDMDQRAREKTMSAFRNRAITVLVCTDVASRGIDVKDVTHVINYSIPREIENYIHRIGRTARSGKKGIAMNLVSPNNRSALLAVERVTQSKILEGKIPSRKEIGERKIGTILKTFEAQTTFEKAVVLLTPEWKARVQEMPKEEIIGRFLTLTYPEVFSEDRAKAVTGKDVKHFYPERSERSGRSGRDQEPRRGGGRGGRPPWGRSASRSRPDGRGGRGGSHTGYQGAQGHRHDRTR